MLNAKVKFLFVVGCVMILGTWLVGCKGSKSGPSTEPVSGMVTLDGKPVAKANVVFVPDAQVSRPSASLTKQENTCSRRPIRKTARSIGSYKVTIAKVIVDRPMADLDLSGLSPEEADKAAMKAFYQSKAGKKIGAQKIAPAASEIPLKYNNIGSSGLKATVAKGPNTIDFPLTSGK